METAETRSTSIAPGMPTKIVVADDHSMFREMLLHILTYRGDKCVVMAEAADGGDALALVARYAPDILLLDYKMPGIGRLADFCKEVARRSATTRILVLSGYSEEEIALEAAMGGAKGYIVKGASIDNLLDAIAAVQMGGVWIDPSLPPRIFNAFVGEKTSKLDKIGKLSRRELQVLSLVSQGMSNKQISTHLHIDKRTVKNHLTHIFQKLDVSSRQEAAAQFVREKPRYPKRRLTRESA
jgi:two-component system, NarL family, response regulator DegU